MPSNNTRISPKIKKYLKTQKLPNIIPTFLDNFKVKEHSNENVDTKIDHISAQNRYQPKFSLYTIGISQLSLSLSLSLSYQTRN
jgi:hypothetical protein